MDLLSNAPGPAKEPGFSEEHGDEDLIELETNNEGWSPMPSPNPVSGQNKAMNVTAAEAEENEDSDEETSFEDHDDFSTTKGSSDWIVANSEYPDTPPMQSAEMQSLGIQRADSPLNTESIDEMENEATLDPQVDDGDAMEDVEMSDESSLFIENPQVRDDGSSIVTVIYAPLPKTGEEAARESEIGPNSSESTSGNAGDPEEAFQVLDGESDTTSSWVPVLSSPAIVTLVSEGGDDNAFQMTEEHEFDDGVVCQHIENVRPVQRQFEKGPSPNIPERIESQEGTSQMDNMTHIPKCDSLKYDNPLSLSDFPNPEDLSAKINTSSSAESSISPRRKRKRNALEAAPSNRTGYNSALKGGNSADRDDNTSNFSSLQPETEARVTARKTVRFDVPSLETFPGYRDPVNGWEPEGMGNSSSDAEWVKVEKNIIINKKDGSSVTLPSNRHNLGSPRLVSRPYCRYIPRKSPSHLQPHIQFSQSTNSWQVMVFALHTSRDNPLDQGSRTKAPNSCQSQDKDCS